MMRGRAQYFAGHDPVAISGSAAVGRRRDDPAEAGSAIVIVDASGRVRMVSGEAAPILGSDVPTGAPLLGVIDVGDEGPRLEQAIRRAAAGFVSELELGIAGAIRSVRCAPLSGDLTPGRALIAVAITDSRRAAAELAELRARANDLELLMTAGRRLARSGRREEVRETACETAAAIAGSDLAALVELGSDRRSLVVVAANDEELANRTVPLEHAEPASRALSAAQLVFDGETPGWPLEEVGARAGAWQPVRHPDGVRAVIVVGWRRPAPPPSQRVAESLGLLAEEVAVATERATAFEQLTGLARTDPLTELSNSRAWRDELGRELARAERSGQRFAVGLIDLDNLKHYNDQWGHAAGDRVLLTAAARWRRRLRLTDLLARIGGDEFAAAMPGCGLAEGVELADQLRAALPDGVTCSIGVAEWSGSESAADLLARADQALYAAKDSGRDATFSLPTPAGPRAGSPLPSR